jgi:hypothetical protein
VPVVVGAVWLLVALRVVAALVVAATALLGQQTVLREQSILVVVVVAGEVLHQLAAQAALALLSLKYLTTYPQHSLVALHLACPHPVGSTSTL